MDLLTLLTKIPRDVGREEPVGPLIQQDMLPGPARRSQGIRKGT